MDCKLYPSFTNGTIPTFFFLFFFQPSSSLSINCHFYWIIIIIRFVFIHSFFCEKNISPHNSIFRNHKFLSTESLLFIYIAKHYIATKYIQYSIRCLCICIWIWRHEHWAKPSQTNKNTTFVFRCWMNGSCMQ